MVVNGGWWNGDSGGSANYGSANYVAYAGNTSSTGIVTWPGAGWQQQVPPLPPVAAPPRSDREWLDGELGRVLRLAPAV